MISAGRTTSVTGESIRFVNNDNTRVPREKGHLKMTDGMDGIWWSVAGKKRWFSMYQFAHRNSPILSHLSPKQRIRFLQRNAGTTKHGVKIIWGAYRMLSPKYQRYVAVQDYIYRDWGNYHKNIGIVKKANYSRAAYEELLQQISDDNPNRHLINKLHWLTRQPCKRLLNALAKFVDNNKNYTSHRRNALRLLKKFARKLPRPAKEKHLRIAENLERKYPELKRRSPYRHRPIHRPRPRLRSHWSSWNPWK
jgi:hypothetical protein